MKQLTFISGALSGSTIGLGLLFKIQHWPGANILAVVGLVMLSLIFIPSLSAYWYKKSN